MLKRLIEVTRYAWKQYKRRARYPHDCRACEWLGRYKEFDLYYCGKKQSASRPLLGGTLIARYGWRDKYRSMPHDLWIANRPHVGDHLPEIEAAYQKYRSLHPSD